MKAMLANFAIVSGLSFALGNAVAEPAPATPENEYTVQEAVAAMFSPVRITPEMVVRVEFCRYKVNRPNTGAERILDFTKLNDVFAFAGLTGDLSGGKADIIMSGPAIMCLDSGECIDEFTIQEASARQFMTVHSAAADVVRLCNPSASYKACASGAYRGFRCAD